MRTNIFVIGMEVVESYGGRKRVNHEWGPHINQDSNTECYMLTVHGSHMLIKIPTQNATH